MKSLKGYLSVIFLAMTIFIVGCNNVDNGDASDGNNASESNENSNSSTTTSGEVQNLAVGGSTSGSTAFAYSVVIGNIVESYTDNIKLQIQETTGTVEGTNLLLGNSIDIAANNSITTIDAKEGVGPFEDAGENEDLRLMWNMYATPYNMVVAQDSDISSPEDFVGKKVGSGAPGSSSYVMLLSVLEAYDINPDDVDIQALSPEEQDTAFRDGHLDVMTFLAGPGTAWLMDLSRSRDLKWLDISEDIFNKMAESKSEGYYVLNEIPSGSYEGLDEPVNAIASNVEWITTSDLDEETVYTIVKTFWDNKDEADGMHAIIKENTPEQAFGSASVPWHSGVIKYLEENNIEYKEYTDN